MRKANATPDSNAAARPTRNRYTAAQWPCVFSGEFVREQVDPRIKAEWAEKREDKPKFGDLRNTFRRDHCRTLNPYGSETCPFRESECATAFLVAVTQSIAARNPHGYFIKVARSTGAARADMAVERRARMRTDVANEDRVGRPARAGVPEGPALGVGADRGGRPSDMDPVQPRSEPSVRSPFARPDHIWSVLRALDVRPRALPDDDAEEGTR